MSELPVWGRRRWVVGHVVCLALIVAFVNLGLWQLSRLHQRRAHNALLRGRMAAAAEPLDRVLASGDLHDVAYRRVSIEGRWVPGGTMLVRARALAGRPGYHVLGILQTGPARATVVNRGFTPIGGGGEDLIRRSVAPPTAPVRVTGVLRPPETRGRIGPRDPASGRLTVLNRIDVGRIQRQSDLALSAGFVQLVTSTGDRPALPQLLPLPDTSNEGPHLNYAGQWFLFATIGAIGWPFVVRRAVRADAGEIADTPVG